MAETQASWKTAATQSAIWVTCRECGHTSRVLSVMASRVLQDRDKCSECFSAELPRLNQTPVGTGIVLSDLQRAALRETEDEGLHAWIAAAPRERWYDWLQQAATSRLAHRFSKRRRNEHDLPLVIVPPEGGLALSHVEK